MKVAALQTMGLSEPSEVGIEAFRSMLMARYKLLARYVHPDKNDSCCDTTVVFSQIRLAKEVLEQELQGYRGCTRSHLKRLWTQMVRHFGFRRDCFVSEHPSGVVMNILEDGLAQEPMVVHPVVERSDDEALDSITTVESRSVSESASSPRDRPSEAEAVDMPRPPPAASSGAPSGTASGAGQWELVAPTRPIQ